MFSWKQKMEHMLLIWEVVPRTANRKGGRTRGKGRGLLEWASPSSSGWGGPGAGRRWGTLKARTELALRTLPHEGRGPGVWPPPLPSVTG